MTSTSVTTSSTSPRSSASALHTPLAGTPVHALWTGAGDGDMRFIGEGPAPAPVPDTLAVRRPHQEHGSRVLVVDSPGHEVPDGALPWAWGPRHSAPEGDAVVASGSGFALAVLTADCAAVALGSPEGVHGAVHVGWRGLGAGILPGAIDTLRRLGASTVVAGMGPCIGPCCYEFSAEDLGALPRLVRGRSGRYDDVGSPFARPARCGAWPTVTLRRVDTDRAGWVHHVHPGLLLAPWTGRRGPPGAVRVAPSLTPPAGPGSAVRTLAPAPPPDVVAARVAALRVRIEEAGRDPAGVRIVAVTKGFTSSAVDAARAAGLYDIGENYANEFLAKVAALSEPSSGAPETRWHFLGAVQRRQVRALAPVVSCWQTLCRVAEGETIARHAPGAAVLVEVETTAIPGRNGCAPSEVAALVASLRATGLDVRGLMTVGPPGPLRGPGRHSASRRSWPTTSDFPRCRWA